MLRSWRKKLVACAVILVLIIFHLWFFMGYNGSTIENWCLKELPGCGTKFGHERGDYSFTVVTGLLDIGRGSWWTDQARSYRDYLGYLLRVLRLDVNLVVFIEEKGRRFVKINRRGREHRTAIYTVSLPGLKLYPLLPKITEIMRSNEYRHNNTNLKERNAEALFPLYNLVTNSKVDLLRRGMRLNRFATSYFVWIDAGYGHGETEETGIFPKDGVWIPNHMIRHPEKVTFTALKELPKAGEITKDTYKTTWTPIAGGLYGGGIQALKIFLRLYDEAFHELLSQGIIDDDQTTFLEAYKKNVSNFRPIRGKWYDLMKAPKTMDRAP